MLLEEILTVIFRRFGLLILPFEETAEHPRFLILPFLVILDLFVGIGFIERFQTDARLFYD
jgi:hypothetical protein